MLRIETIGAAAEKAGAGQHMELFSRIGCENWENVRKAAQIYVFHIVHNRISKKTLQKPCEFFVQCSNFRNISQIPQYEHYAS